MYTFICSKSTKKEHNHLQDKGYFWEQREENEIREEYTKGFDYVYNILFIKLGEFITFFSTSF